MPLLGPSPLTRVFAGSDSRPFGRRLRSPRGARLPMIVVTGFLGAGKTTLIRDLLATPDGSDTLVIVNELGEVGIDDALLRGGAETTVLLGNGCLCCALRSDLQATLREVLSERGSGRLPSFQRIVLETSGLADPVPILATLAGDRGLAGEIHVDAVVTVVDAVLGAETLAHAPEARRQIMVADRVILTKAEIAGADASAALERRLGALNAAAPVTRAQRGRVAPAALIAPALAAAERHLPAAPSRAAHSDGISTFCLELPVSMPWAVYAQTMAMLADLRGADLLRAKGLLAIEGCRGPVVVHQVQHLGSAPVELAAWPDGNATPRLVFITRDIAREDVEALFALTLRLARGGPAPEQVRR